MKKQRGAGLSIEKVVRAAVELADTQGLKAVTMSRVAESLGVQAMSLYAWTDSKADLEARMFEVVASGFWLAPPDSDPREGIIAMEETALNALMEHPWTAPLMVRRETLTPSFLAYMERIALLVGRLDVGADVSLVTLNALNRFLLAMALAEHVASLHELDDLARSWRSELPTLAENSETLIGHLRGNIERQGEVYRMELRITVNRILDFALAHRHETLEQLAGAPPSLGPVR